MVFVTLGSQKFQFNRLLKAVDGLVEKGIIHDQVFAQTGYSDYEPKHYAFENFLNRNEFAACTRKCDIFITHGGTGAIIGAVKQRKKVIAVPRRAKYGEHVDDHQIQLIEQFNDLNLIYGCRDCDDLETALNYVNSHDFETYQSNTKTIIDSLDRYIQKIL
ncbi:MAG: PssE/Cps14G family polysaccharide biosynthesis glycosyltransferase [Candidatus Limivicinus sp.]|jgi:UDP-N-acetylglucosamine transferase subunit ALG13